MEPARRRYRFAECRRKRRCCSGLCNDPNKDYRSFQARFALGIPAAESRSASLVAEEKRRRACDEKATLRFAVPRRSLSPFPHFVAVLRRIAPWPRIPNVGTAFSMFAVIQTMLQIVKANSR